MGFFDRFFGPLTEAGFAKLVIAEMKRVGDDSVARGILMTLLALMNPQGLGILS